MSEATNNTATTRGTVGTPQCELRAAGKPYPRTCDLCGLGPCQRQEGYQVNSAEPVTLEKFAAEIAAITDTFLEEAGKAHAKFNRDLEGLMNRADHLDQEVLAALATVQLRRINARAAELEE
jgi:hypothetical protein